VTILNKLKPNLVALAGILITVSLYASFLFKHALNVPLGDDITDVLQVLTGVLNSDSFAEAWKWLFDQHNDHRTLSSRLVYLLVYGLADEINFRTLNFIASAGQLGLLALLYLGITDRTRRWLILFPATLLLLNLRAYGLTLWPMATFAYVYVYLYGFASLYCLHQTGKSHFLLALLFACLATFSLASGQVVWIVGLAVLIHRRILGERQSGVHAIAWILSAIVVLWLWRWGLETPNTIGGVLRFFIESPWHHMYYYFALLGAAATGSSALIAALFGICLLALICLSSYRQRQEFDTLFEWYGWYIALSVAAMALGRAPYSTIEYALSSRYSFPSLLMVSTCWVLVATRFQLHQPRPLAIVTLTALVYCFSSYSLYSKELQPYVEKRVKRFNHQSYWIFGRKISDTNSIVDAAVAKGIYNPPSRPLPIPKIAEEKP
jgi:hypothetical protein